MGIQIEKLKIDSEFKEKINKTFSRKNLEITYFNGYIVKFNKCNMESISPHKILFSSPTKNLIVLHYADYMENDGFVRTSQLRLVLFLFRKICYN